MFKILLKGCKNVLRKIKMKIIDADEMIHNLEVMKKFGYDSIMLDGMIKGLKDAKEIESIYGYNIKNEENE